MQNYRFDAAQYGCEEPCHFSGHLAAPSIGGIEEAVRALAEKRPGSWSLTVWHIDGTRNGKRFGEWIPTATYTPLPQQPAQDLMTDTDQWRAFCYSQVNQPGTQQ